MDKKIPVVSVENKDQAQAMANFLWNEKERHFVDIAEINKDLYALVHNWGVQPNRKRIFVSARKK